MDFTLPPYAPVPFSFLVTIGWISVFLIVGMFLRSVFPVFRRFLIPACIIGGIAGFIFESSGILDLTGFALNNGISAMIVYHLFNLTWVYMGLRPGSKEKQKVSTTKTVIWYSGFISAIMYFAFGFSILATTVLGEMGFHDGPLTMGTLTAYGFTAGPGQALTIANVWMAAKDFVALPDFALAGGAMGFAVAIIVGIPLMNIIARKKNLDLLSNPSEEEECGFYNDCTPTEDAGQQTTSATSIDVLAWHLALGLGTYLLSFVVAIGLFVILPPQLKIFVWSMFFIFGSLLGMLVRTILVKIGKGHLLCSGIVNRVSNTLVDFMVCATFMTISLGTIMQYMAPFLASALASTLAVGLGTWYYTRKLKYDGIQNFAYMFGLMTGTVSTAFILLRLVDPNNKSQVPFYFAICSAVTAPISTFAVPALMHLEPVYGGSAWLVIGVFLAMAIAGAIVARIFQLPQTKTAWEPEEQNA